MAAGHAGSPDRAAVTKDRRRQALDPGNGVKQHPPAARRLLGRVDPALTGKQEAAQLTSAGVNIARFQYCDGQQHDPGSLALVAEGPHGSKR